MVSVLEGIQVLDLSWGIAGPVTGMLLADHGADVIKVEPPGGDPFRGTPGYDVWLRGRRSIELDLGAAEDHERFLDLARNTDVVLTSYGPDVALHLGVDGPSLCGENPRLIHCSITGYGDHPAHRDRPAFEALAAARLGILHEQRGHFGGAIPHMHGEEPFLADLEVPDGMEPGAPRSGPIFTYTPWLSMCAAYNASVGINAALLARLTTGRGQQVSTSLLQAAMTVTAAKWMRVGNPHATGLRTWVHDSRAPKGFFKCSDGRWVQQWVPNPRFIFTSADGDTLALRRDVDRVLDDPDRIPQDPENIVVLAHYYTQMAETMARFPSDAWTEVGREAGVPLQPVRTPEEALQDEALLAEGAVVDVPHPEHGLLRQAGILYGLSATPGAVAGPVPRVGEHSRAILEEAEALAASRTHPDEVVHEPLAAPLAGVLVLDIGFAVAGPFGTQVLADMGATVIKVNTWRDPWWHASHIAYAANRGKRSIGIDLKSPDGLAVFHRLLERADVVHSNMRRDALKRLRCDEASLRRVNPDIIYCHTRGFDRGPRSDSPGNDQTGCSLAGVTFEDGGCRDGGKPFWSLTSLGDTGNGFLSAIGVIQALYHRKRTGEPQSVDTSILNAGLLVASMCAVGEDGAALPRPHLDGMQLGLGALYRLYETSDGWVCVAAIGQRRWHALATALAAPELISDPRFADAAGRERDREALGAALEPHFRSRSAAKVAALLDAAGVPCEVADAEFALGVHDDPDMHALGLVVEQEHPKVGKYETYGTTIDLSDTPQRIWGPPPLCGQHTREIMHELDYSDGEIDELVEARGVFEELWVD
jgi:crotonobetainyl-CoA:carnitine CoA-transferase CaiB-like acyl-CoA transferase